MKRSAACSVVFGLAMFCWGARALAQSNTSILMSGQSSALIDTNGNGIPDGTDGSFQGTIAGNSLTFMGAQGSGQGDHQLRALTGNFLFNVVQFTPGGMAILQQTGAPNITPPIQPSHFASLTASNPSGANTFTKLSVTTGGHQSGAAVCTSSGQPAAQVTLDDGLTMNVSLGYYPDARTPSFLRVPGVPFQEAGSSSFFMTNLFLPVTKPGGIAGTSPVLDLATANDPSNPFFRLTLNQLPACPHGTSVPSMSGGVLLLVVLAIMALGVWGLGRRRAFYQALPLP